ncbi:hypothetical protein V6N13_005804 [Hibiscus sabdariffa]|uniref:Uncharacterized protein n=1 Tax=Hibiscus sabdariffa TaxID=183260 RepID=A0ABR2EPP0_9ROSI
MDAPPASGVIVSESTTPPLVVDATIQLDLNVMKHEKAVVVGVGKVVSSEKIVHVRVSLDPEAHVAVHVIELGKELASLSGSGRCSSTGVGLSSLNNNMLLPIGKGWERKGDQARKKASGRISHKVQLGEWIGRLKTELSDSGGEKLAQH